MNRIRSKVKAQRSKVDCRGGGRLLYFPHLADISLSRPWTTVVFFLLFTVYSSPFTVVHAEEAPLSLAEAWQLALSQYELVMLSEEDVHQADQGIEKARSQLLPKLTLGGNYTRYSESTTSQGFNVQPDYSTSFSATLSQSLYSGGKEWNLWRQAKKKAEGSRFGFEATKEGVVLDASRLYFTVLKSIKTVEIKEAALRRAQEQRRVAQARFQVGEVTKSVVLRAEAEVAGVEAELANAKKDLLVAKDKLASFLGLSGDFSIVDPDIQPLPETSLDALISHSLEKREDYMQSKIDEEIAEEGIGYAKGNFLPSLRLEGVYERRDQSPKSTFFVEDTLYGGLIVTYPIFEGGLRKAELDEAKSKKRQAELKRLNLRKNIELEVREAFHILDTFHSVIESNKRQVSFAEENYTMVFKQFSYGLATNVDVIDANTTLVSSQSNLINALYDYQVAILELKKRVGILVEDMTASK